MSSHSTRFGAPSRRGRAIQIVFITLLLLFGCESGDRPQVPVAVEDPGNRIPLRGLEQGGPFLEVVVPSCPGLNPANVPPITTFEWSTLEGVADPDSVRWILVNVDAFGADFNDALDYIRTHPNADEWQDWHLYDPGAGMGTRWTTPPLNFGRYVFAAQGKRVGGFPEPDFEFGRNAVRVLVSQRSTGPLLTLTSDLMNPVVSAVITTPPTILQVTPGTAVSFCWGADATAYCGVIADVRYAWDITDLDDEDQWESVAGISNPADGCIDTRSFYFGTHNFFIDAVDNSGFRTRIPVRINVTPGAVSAALDIRPGSCTNPLNPKSRGVLPVALVGSSVFDVGGVDISSLVLKSYPNGVGAVTPGQVKVEDIVEPGDNHQACDCPAGGVDGYDDLLLKFSVAEIARIIDPAAGTDVRLALCGKLQDGRPFIAVDCARIVGVKFKEPPVEPEDELDTELLRVVSSYAMDNQIVTEEIDFQDAAPDTVPFRSWVTLFYRGTPDPATALLCSDPINECIGFQKNFTWSSSEVPFTETTPFLPYSSEDNDPFGTSDSTSLNVGSASYTVRIRSVDQFGDRDLTPATATFVGNFEPAIDDAFVEDYDGARVPDGGDVVWDWWNPANYHGSIADTLDLTDPPNLWVLKEFYFVVAASGHDHPKDAALGGVKSWLYTFHPLDDPASIAPIGRSGLWHDGIATNVERDTVRVTVRYSPVTDPGGLDAYANLPEWLSRRYVIRVRGRDTSSVDNFEQFMFVNGDRWLINAFNASALGLKTEVRETTHGVTIVR